MPVLTWGYGTGSTGGTAQPFGLRIQGVDYIGSVPIDSISVSASASSNATLTFSILDTTGTLPIPAGWADVEFVDYTEEEIHQAVGYVFGTLHGIPDKNKEFPGIWFEVPDIFFRQVYISEC